MIDYEKQFAGFFNQLADAASDIALKYFRQLIPVDDKEDKSPVTQADREIEAALRRLINKAFPDHGIIGEEYGKEKDDAEFVWVIDPIDGTKSFITGRPLFGAMIGLMHNGKPVVGLIDQAYTKERWFGITDRYASHNGTLIKVATPRSLDNARLYTGSIAMFEGDNFENYLKLCRAAKLTQYACDCYAYGLLAMGWADIVVEQNLKIYDAAAVVPILSGAGGFVSDWNMRPIDLSFDGHLVAASSQRLAEQAVVIMSIKK
jgi:histidinol phosphatase-like enzyme (inositol monophosphatase family)